MKAEQLQQWIGSLPPDYDVEFKIQFGDALEVIEAYNDRDGRRYVIALDEPEGLEGFLEVER